MARLLIVTEGVEMMRRRCDMRTLQSPHCRCSTSLSRNTAFSLVRLSHSWLLCQLSNKGVLFVSSQRPFPISSAQVSPLPPPQEIQSWDTNQTQPNNNTHFIYCIANLIYSVQSIICQTSLFLFISSVYICAINVLCMSVMCMYNLCMMHD